GTGDVAGAAVRPLPQDARLADVSAELRELALATGGTLAGPLPPEAPPAPPAPARRPLAPLLPLIAAFAIVASVLVRRWPARARPAVAALLALFGASAALPAQQGDPIRERIDAELRRVGHLDALRAEWQDGTPEQRLALAREAGDLD